MSIGMVIGSLAGFILFFVLLVIFAPYLSIFAYGIGFVYGAIKFLFSLFAYVGASCSNISLLTNVFLTLLLFFLFYKIYKLFKGSASS